MGLPRDRVHPHGVREDLGDRAGDDGLIVPELFRIRLSLLLSVRLGRNPLHRMPHQPVCAGSARPYMKP